MPGWVTAHRNQLPVHPGTLKIHLGLLFVTVAAYAITWLSSRKGQRSICAYLLFGCIAAMLANVFLPHVPATLVFRQYTPGVATALLINLPLMSILLVKAVREQWVAGVHAILAALLIPLAIAGSIAALFMIP